MEFPDRARQWLTFVADHTHHAGVTTWGKYQAFDGHALAALAIGRTQAAHALLAGTVQMMAGNFAEESANPAAKWHLADFAAHPLLHAWLCYGDASPIWQRVADTFSGFLFHRNDLTENHNLLHHALRYLIAHRLPELLLESDARSPADRLDESRGDVLAWISSYLTRGSIEWGSELYYNVLLLALLNLHDFAEPAIAERATEAIEFLLADQLLDAWDGSVCGAARRAYSCYRIHPRENPSRPLHYVLFGTGQAPDPFNLNFIGGAILSACSDYRPSAHLLELADRCRQRPIVASVAHSINPLPGAALLTKYVYRSPKVMLSTMMSPGGSDGRGTEQVWQATLGDPEAILFSNHPILNSAWTLANSAVKASPAQIIARYHAGETGSPGTPLWVTANVPPGHPGDVRPGFWQGNGIGPTARAERDYAWCVYQIPPDDPLPYVHLFLPRHRFDDVVHDSAWLFARRGGAWAGVWSSAVFTPTTVGTWADIEWIIPAAACGLFVQVGDDSKQSFEDFQRSARQRQPQFDGQTLTFVDSSQSPVTQVPAEQRMVIVDV